VLKHWMLLHENLKLLLECKRSTFALVMSSLAIEIAAMFQNCTFKTSNIFYLHFFRFEIVHVYIMH
jgi:hypothetical protein